MQSWLWFVCYILFASGRYFDLVWKPMERMPLVYTLCRDMYR